MNVFLFFFRIIVVLFLRRGVHINKKYLYSLLFYSEKTALWKMRESMGFSNSDQPITFVQITCTFFLSMIAQLCLLRGISSWELGSTQPIPSFLKIIYMQHFFFIIIYNTSTDIYLLSYLPPQLNFIVFFYGMLNFIVIISRVSLHAKIYVKDVDAINVSSLLFFLFFFEGKC